MVFTSALWLPSLPKIPNVSLCEFMFDEEYGRAPIATSLPAYVCSISNQSISALEQKQRVEFMARALAHELGWSVNEGSEFDKVVGIFALNTVDLPTLTWAIHRVNGVCAPMNASYTEGELATLFRKAKAKAIFTVLPLLTTARKAAKLCDIPQKHVYVCNLPGDPTMPLETTTIAQLLEQGQQLPSLEPLKWTLGQSERQTAFLSHTSGTSGLPKLAAISHRNIIANIVEINLFEQDGRGGPDAREVMLGVLPSSHIYGVVVISHLSTYRGDSVIVLPRFDMVHMLDCVAKHRINILSVVPPIVVGMGKNPELLRKYDLSSVKTVLSGGAPLDQETLNRLSSYYPHWIFRQGYGLTEIGAVISLTNIRDTWAGSSGLVIPGIRIKLLRDDGTEVTEYEQPGEVWAQSAGVIIGYVGDENGTNETFVQKSDGRWLRTGDIALFKKSATGNEHIFIVDRIKEVIKVNGLQVVPAELEACLLNHPAVAESAVIAVPDERAGELPKAFVQKSTVATISQPDDALAEELFQFVKGQKARHKWLTGGIAFVEAIPKSPSGKILRRLLRDQEREARRRNGASL